MYEIAKLPNEEREILFQNTAAQMGLNAAVIEKDFWVCLTLDYLFHRCQWKKAFAFKGGTSLSKVYGLIDRFSEDIDLIHKAFSEKMPVFARRDTVMAVDADLHEVDLEERVTHHRSRQKSEHLQPEQKRSRLSHTSR